MMYKRIISLMIVISMLSVLWCTAPSYAADVALKDPITSSSNKNYSRLDQTTIVTEGDNSYLKLEKSTSSRCRMTKDSDFGLDGKVVIIGYDFMFEAEPSSMEVETATLQNEANNYASRADFKNGVLYDTKSSSNEKKAIRDDFVQGKWYNIFTVVDTTKSEYQVFSAGYGSEIKKYLDTTNPDWTIDRWIYFENWTKESSFYVDNVELVKIEHIGAEVALRQARGVMLEAEYGYDNGKIPEENKNLLASVCADAEARLQEGTMSESEAEECEKNIREAMALFTDSKIDFNETPGTPSYITSNMRKAILVDSVNGTEYPLSAKVMDTTNNEISDCEIIWELVGDYENISISDGVLIAGGEAEGDVVIKASVESGIYNLFTLQLAEAKRVESLTFSGKDGSISISGVMESLPLEKVTMSVTGEDSTISFSDEIFVNTDKTFEWVKTFDNTVAFQDVTVRIEGDDLAVFEKNYTYYGKGWMQKVTQLFCDAQSTSEIGELLENHADVLGLDKEDYNAYKEEYNEALYSERDSFLNIGDIKNKLEEVYLTNHPDGRPEDAAEKKAASTVVFGENFEDYSIEDGVVRTSEKNYGVSSGVRVYGDINNKYATIKKDSANDARLAHDFKHQDTNKNELPLNHPDNEIGKYALNEGFVSVSFDYCLQSDPSSYDVELLGVLMDVANKPATFVDLKNGILYDGQSDKGTTSVLKNNLVKNKWYHIMVLLDCDNRDYSVYTGDAMSEELSFSNTSETAIIDRFFSMRMRSQNTPLNFDNIKVSKVNYPSLEVALHKAQALIMEAEGKIGYKNGQYPESTYNLLKDYYDVVQKENQNADITEEEAALYADELLEIVDIFAGSRINKSDAPGKAAFIESDVPKAIGIGKSEYSIELDAKIMDTTNNETEGKIYWKIVNEDFYNAELWGNKLVVEPDTRGEITLKAYTESGLYNLYNVVFTDIKELTFISCEAKDAKVRVSGNFNKLPMEKVNVSVTGNAADKKVEVEGVAKVAEDGSFVFEKTVDSALLYQMTTVRVGGYDIKEYSDNNVPYYGIGWEEAVRKEFNKSTSEEITKSLIETYYVGVGVEKSSFEKDKDVYANAVYNGGKDYAAISELTNVTADTRCVLDFSYVTRKTIEDVMQHNLSSLTRNGFDSAIYNSLEDTELTGFLVFAANINIDKAKDSATDVVALLNELLPKKEASSGGDTIEGGTGSSGGSGGGGGGGGSFGGSGKGDYNVSLVTPDGKTEDDKKPTDDANMPEFEDASLTPWAKDALIFVRREGIMEGDGTNVRPADAVTRGEIAKILVKAFKLTAGEGNMSFEDGNGVWWNEYAQIIAEAGIMIGIGANNFGGQSFVTREMLAVAIDRAIARANMEFYDKNEGVSFKDSDEIASYARESIERLAKKGIVSGMGNGVFAPKLYVTRAEAAQMIYNVLSD